MKKSRFGEEQIIGFLKQAEAGIPIKELCRNGGFSHATFYKWRAKFGGLQVSEAQRLRELESENASSRAAQRVRLGRVVAEEIYCIKSQFHACGLRSRVERQ